METSKFIVKERGGNSETARASERVTERQTDWHRDRQRETGTDRNRDRQKQGQRDRNRDREKQGQRDRQTQGQTDKQKQRDKRKQGQRETRGGQGQHAGLTPSLFRRECRTKTQEADTCLQAPMCSGPLVAESGFTISRREEEASTVMPDVWIPKREERRPPRQCNSQKGKFIADSSQGSCRIQRSGAGSESPKPKLLHKFIGWA